MVTRGDGGQNHLDSHNFFFQRLLGSSAVCFGLIWFSVSAVRRRSLKDVCPLRRPESEKEALSTRFRAKNDKTRLASWTAEVLEGKLLQNQSLPSETSCGDVNWPVSHLFSISVCAGC